MEAALRALVPAEAEALGISTHVCVIDGGKAAADIVQAAERLAVDAIVVGAHGRGRAARALLGSVSAGWWVTSQRPVLVVPSRTTAEAGLPQAGVGPSVSP